MRYLVLLLVVGLAGCGDAPKTPFGRAAAYGTEIELRAEMRGASPSEIQAALIAASRGGNRMAVPILVGAGADPNREAGVNSWPPLMHAIHKNRIASAQALIEGGADVNYANVKGYTPLMMAAGYGYSDIVQLLLKKGADPARKDGSGNTALDLAVHGLPDVDRFTRGNCQSDTVQTLLKQISDKAIVTHAIGKEGSCKEIRALLDAAAQRQTTPHS